ncbi:hypothetical protein TRFO_04117 [Tritrichomonas foetus]|uniref:Myb-like DNA-binding domain containing protein n=1 Tax=Tritrichomonas foetus TaxID=1144522 RepID=A0A1J4KLF3_9EUKA|nr:hypothetical protein TRFO_04117 [Tritrichomonas foetus]|eukprot:OHT10628.1 hypothetical protein TRFO_04117 [Tritrichomonas foetus]
MRRKWTEEEDSIILNVVAKNGKHWELLSSMLPNRTTTQISAHYEKCLDPTLVKGPFTLDEDRIITSFVTEHGTQAWTKIKSYIPSRTPKQCRERWLNHLAPGVDNKREWTSTEDEFILRAVSTMGQRWAAIAKMMPGRTDNSIKNRYNSSISKRVVVDSTGKITLTPQKSQKSAFTSTNSNTNLQNYNPNPISSSQTPNLNNYDLKPTTNHHQIHITSPTNASTESFFNENSDNCSPNSDRGEINNGMAKLSGLSTHQNECGGTACAHSNLVGASQQLKKVPFVIPIITTKSSQSNFPNIKTDNISKTEAFAQSYEKYNSPVPEPGQADYGFFLGECDCSYYNQPSHAVDYSNDNSNDYSSSYDYGCEFECNNGEPEPGFCPSDALFSCSPNSEPVEFEEFQPEPGFSTFFDVANEIFLPTACDFTKA